MSLAGSTEMSWPSKPDGRECSKRAQETQDLYRRSVSGQQKGFGFSKSRCEGWPTTDVWFKVSAIEPPRPREAKANPISETEGSLSAGNRREGSHANAMSERMR